MADEDEPLREDPTVIQGPVRRPPEEPTDTAPLSHLDAREARETSSMTALDSVGEDTRRARPKRRIDSARRKAPVEGRRKRGTPVGPEGRRRPELDLPAEDGPRRSLFRRLLVTMLAVLAIYGGLTLLLAWQLGATVLEEVFVTEIAPAQLLPLEDAVAGLLMRNPTPAEVQEFLERRYARLRRNTVAVYDTSGTLVGQRAGTPGPAPDQLEPEAMAALVNRPMWRDPGGFGFVAVGTVRGGSPLESEPGPVIGFVRLAARPQVGRARDLIVGVSWRWSFPVFLLSALAAFLGTSSITQRLREAEKAVRRIAGGEQGVRIEVDTSRELDEIGQVSLAFNQTVDALEATVRELERTDENRRRLVADFAHELNTPLTNVLAYLETLMIAENEGGMSPVDRKGFLSVAHDEARRLSHLAKDLETVTKLEAGALRMDRQVVDVSRLAVGLAQRIEPRATGKGLEVLTDIEAGGEIVGDPMRLEQVGMNLLENAMRYTNAGWIRIEVRLLDDGVELAVADSGMGIPAEDIERVMERFYRVDPSRNRATGGSGLGLSIVGRIVQRHGGEVRIESTLGEGSRFIVYLPHEGSTHDVDG